MTPFFVLSLPRTRTAWLANFLTWGDVFAYHEGTLGCDSPEAVRAKLAAGPGRINGIVDTAAALVIAQLLAVMPEARVVCLTSNPLTSWQRMRRILPDLPLQVLLAVADAIEAASALPGVLTLPAEAITEADGMRELLAHVAPGAPFGAARFEALQDFNIQVDNRRLVDRIVANTAATERLYGEVR